jgi:hypothetical protein
MAFYSVPPIPGLYRDSRTHAQSGADPGQSRINGVWEAALPPSLRECAIVEVCICGQMSYPVAVAAEGRGAA